MGCVGSTAEANKQEAAKPKRQGKERYVIGEELGKGHFAEVRTCMDLETNTKFALKIIDKKDLVKSAETVKEEIAILRQVGHHKHVVALDDTFEDEKQFYLVMELCEGGDLFSKIVQEGKYSEKRAVRCCRQLADALQWIHKRGVTHRDLKPENILLTSDNIDADIKVADFGLSKLMKNQQDVMRTVCGTWAYCAPEVIARKPYTQAVDNWTLGVLMFILLSGYHPFDVYGELPEPQLLRKIMDCSYDFDDDVWMHVSDEAKNLIRGLLKLEPRDRISLDTFLASPWIKGEGVKDRELPMVVTRLEKLNKGRRKFRALVLAKLASKKFKRNLDRSRSKNPSSQSISLGSYPHGNGFMGGAAGLNSTGAPIVGVVDFESARSDRSDQVMANGSQHREAKHVTIAASPVTTSGVSFATGPPQQIPSGAAGGGSFGSPVVGTPNGRSAAPTLAPPTAVVNNNVSPAFASASASFAPGVGVPQLQPLTTANVPTLQPPTAAVAAQPQPLQPLQPLSAPTATPLTATSLQQHNAEHPSSNATPAPAPVAAAAAAPIPNSVNHTPVASTAAAPESPVAAAPLPQSAALAIDSSAPVPAAAASATTVTVTIPLSPPTELATLSPPAAATAAAAGPLSVSSPLLFNPSAENTPTHVGSNGLVPASISTGSAPAPAADPQRIEPTH